MIIGHGVRPTASSIIVAQPKTDRSKNSEPFLQQFLHAVSLLQSFSNPIWMSTYEPRWKRELPLSVLTHSLLVQRGVNIINVYKRASHPV